MLPRSSILGRSRLLCSFPQPATVQLAAAGRTLHRPAVATPTVAAAQQQNASQQQPRARQRKTRSSSSRSSSNIQAIPVGSATNNSTPGITASSGTGHNSSSLISLKNNEPEPYSLASCTRLLALHSAFLSRWHSSNTSSDTTSKHSISTEQQHANDAAAVLQPHGKPGDYWLFVRCGSLSDSRPGPGSAALAVLQLWLVGEGKGDYTLWRLDNNGLPTGQAFFSLTGKTTRTRCLPKC
jgi:hypothetical protein